MSLADRVRAYDAEVRRLAASARAPEDWAPLAAFVDTEAFERVGTFREVHDWDGYVAMLTAWAGAIGRFETTVKRVTEAPPFVFYEIEERHFSSGEPSGEPHVVNSMTVFGFDDAERITSLAVYLQQAR